MSSERLSLPEELLLLALHPAKGHLRDRDKLKYGLSAAVLGELEAAGVVRPEAMGKRFAILRPAPTGDPQLDETAGRLRAGERPKTKTWVRRNARRVHEPYLSRLVAGRTLQARAHRVLGVFPVTRYTVLDKELLSGVRSRLDQAAHGRKTLDDSTRLGALVAAVRLDRHLYRGGENRELRRRLKELTKRDWTAEAARQNVKSDEAAAAEGSG
jgi:hypothetical protein